MKRALLYSSLLGAATLGVIAATFKHPGSEFEFLKGADCVNTRDALIRNNVHAEIQAFNLHMPFNQAWGLVENELTAKNGWKLATTHPDQQIFDLKGKCSIAITAGKVDKQNIFIDGTEGTDTYIVIQTRKG